VEKLTEKYELKKKQLRENKSSEKRLEELEVKAQSSPPIVKPKVVKKTRFEDDEPPVPRPPLLRGPEITVYNTRGSKPYVFTKNSYTSIYHRKSGLDIEGEVQGRYQKSNSPT
jgi:hypothetical protein